MNMNLHRLVKWLWLLMLILLFCGCTVKTTATDESGLPPHLTVDLHVPDEWILGKPSLFSVEVTKSSKPVQNAEKAEFVIWLEGNKESAITIAAKEESPGVYSVTHTLNEEGLYVVQSRINSANEQVMPAKRFAIGAHAIEQLAVLEEAQRSGTPAAPAVGHH
ncbi:FixH family protein [Paenibacillus sp. 2TAB19]|uniref:FixH family protein n=1 Tax=Paenibacillus sp. 2TAB19 TaxID=3233003 RepID=UPI003F96C57F